MEGLVVFDADFGDFGDFFVDLEVRLGLFGLFVNKVICDGDFIDYFGYSVISKQGGKKWQRQILKR
ncbi:MAG TPA: hypothetical protein VLL52_02530 [Anaerolineae bacterium]|nr:hypothetical protein [Anaerolineae bacterium]